MAADLKTVPVEAETAVAVAKAEAVKAGASAAYAAFLEASAADAVTRESVALQKEIRCSGV